MAKLQARIFVCGRECLFNAEGDERAIGEAFTWWCLEVARYGARLQWQRLWANG